MRSLSPRNSNPSESVLGCQVCTSWQLRIYNGHRRRLRKQFLELLPRTVVETARTLFTRVLGLIHRPEEIGHHVTEAAVANRESLVRAQGGGQERKRERPEQVRCAYRIPR